MNPLFIILKKIFTFLFGKEVASMPIAYSSKDGEALTDFEKLQMIDPEKLAVKCPDCGNNLKEGPHGGVAVNGYCSSCGAKFNLCPGLFTNKGILAFVERISDRKTPIPKVA